ncbi:unnamed protein product [Rotaria socialis]|uniref:Uncharacterized protein n=1 Tax=Rotaria socialis TaxID=392032 RepID=A0A820YCD1_9BILA|nr:unnamed protein product [Rotaria socialis]
MVEVKPSLDRNREHLSWVPRMHAVGPRRVKQSFHEVSTSTVRHDNLINGRMLSIPLEAMSFETKPEAKPRLFSSPDNINRNKINKLSSIGPENIFSLNSTEIINPTLNEQRIKNSNGFLSNLTQKQILYLKLTAIFLLIAAVGVLVIFIPIYVLVIRKIISVSSFTNMTASVCSTTTCIGKETPYHSSMVTALYTFDGNPIDWTGSGTGILFGSVLPGYTNQPKASP